MSAKKLTPKQQMFVKEYLVDLNATQAAIRAGYSERTAKSQGQRLLTNVDVQEAVQAGMDKRAAKAELSADMVLDQIRRLMAFDPRKMFDSAGNPLPITDLDDDTALAIAGFDVVNVGNADLGVGQVLKLKMSDRLRAIEMAGRHLKLFTDKIEHSASDDLAASILGARKRAQKD